MPRWWVLWVLLAGSGAVAAAKMPPKPAAHRPAFILSQEKPEQPPKLAATDVAPAVVKVGRLRGGGVPWRPRPPDEDRVGTACMAISGSGLGLGLGLALGLGLGLGLRVTSRLASSAMWKLSSLVTPLCVMVTRDGAAAPSTSMRSRVLVGCHPCPACVALLDSVPG